jgi:hypothetical protein
VCKSKTEKKKGGKNKLRTLAFSMEEEREGRGGRQCEFSTHTCMQIFLCETM